MSSMNVEIYQAFKEVGATEETAQAAGKAFEVKDDRLISVENRLTNIEKEMSSVKQEMSSMKLDQASMKQDLSKMDGRLTNIEKDMSSMKQDHHLLKWMLGVVIAGILYLILQTIPL